MNNDKIVIGDAAAPKYTIEGTPIWSLSAVKAVDVVGDELSIDTLALKVAGDPNDGRLLAPSDYDGFLTSDGYVIALPEGFSKLPDVPYGTPVRYLRDNALFGLFYTKLVKRISASLYRVDATSAVGLLDAQEDHNGGIYTGQTFAAVVAEIVGGAFTYTVDANVAGVTIYGWLPKWSRRKSLHQLLFATGASLLKDAEGNVRFAFLSGADPVSILGTRIYDGGYVDYSTPASAVEITEHAFYALSTDETVTLFDNTDGSGAVENATITFSEAPVHDLAASGNLTIVSSGVNHAVLTGTGTLTGKKYTHVTKVVRMDAANAPGKENVPTVTDATLVSTANSLNVAKRVLAYYSSKRTVGASLVMEGEKPGDVVSFRDPYGNAAKGFISNMEINASSILKAQCEIITGYTPTGQGNNYTMSTLFTGSGTITVPEGGAQLVLIGGGDGGASGGNGEAGNGGHAFPSGFPDGGAGGPVGTPGSGGKILVVTLSEGTYTYVCGSGGEGGAASGTEPTPGAEGGATVIYKDGAALFSSASGVSSDTGYIDVLSGAAYGLPGKNDGVPGGKGGRRGSAAAESVTFEGETWYGGADGTDYQNSSGDSYRGGGGGGAAVGSNGGGGANPDRYWEYFYGGYGGTARARAAATGYGTGGDGGHGGGGGGGGGIGTFPDSDGGGSWVEEGPGGSGGRGGTGGDGADGCVIMHS